MDNGKTYCSAGSPWRWSSTRLAWRSNKIAARWCLAAAMLACCAGLTVATGSAPTHALGQPTGLKALGSIAASKPSAEGTIFRSVLLRSSRVGWMGGAAGEVLRTSDGGMHWAGIQVGHGAIVGFDFVTRHVGWLLEPGVLYGTVNGGRQWSVVSKSDLQSIQFVSRNRGWAVQRVSAPARGSVIAPAFQGRLLTTYNGGRTWLKPSVDPRAQSVCFAGPLRGWVADHKKILETRDGGRTWSRAFRARLTAAQVGVGWQAQLHCGRKGGVWVLFAAQAGTANQDAYVAYRLSRGRWVAMYDESYFNGTSYHLDQYLTEGPGNYPGPFVVLGAKTAYFAGYDFAEPQGIALLRWSRARRQWRRAVVSTLEPAPPVAVSFLNSSRGWLLGQGPNSKGSELLATHDGGRTWMGIYPPRSSWSAGRPRP